MVVDPWGSIVAETNKEDLDVAVVDLQLEKLESVRKNMPCFEHRRDDIYNLTYNGNYDYYTLPESSYDFGGHHIPAEIVFYVTEHCIAFTNLRCVVPGRRFKNLNFIGIRSLE